MMGGIIVNSIVAAGGPSLAIPGPYWLFTLLHWLTFALHLIAMNILFGGLLILIIAKTSPFRKLLFETQTRLFPTVMAATITLGVAPLLFTQVIYGRFFYSASIISGWNWFWIVPVLIVVYYLLYAVAMRQNLSLGSKQIMLVLAAIGMVYISYTFTMISDLAEKPFLWNRIIEANPGGTTLNPSFGETIFRWAHIITGGIAVAGLVIQLFALYLPKIASDRELLRFGGRVYLLGVIKAAVFAVVYLLLIDGQIFKEFLGSPGLHAILGAIVMNIIAAFLVFRSADAQWPKPLVLSSALLVFLGVFCMVIGRHFLRLVYLNGEFSPAALDTSGQLSPLVMFLLVFVAGLLVLFWMIRKYFTARPESS
jgi:hypothetical protein